MNNDIPAFAISELPQAIPENKLTMVKVWFLKLTNQKHIFNWHRHEINDIYNLYYQIDTPQLPEIIHGETVETNASKMVIYSFRANSIMKRFKIKNASELMFLLAQHPENQKKLCKYCKKGFVFMNRSAQTSTCGHDRFCSFENCNEPIKSNSYCDKHRHTCFRVGSKVSKKIIGFDLYGEPVYKNEIDNIF